MLQNEQLSVAEFAISMLEGVFESGVAIPKTFSSFIIFAFWLPWPGTVYAVPQYPAVPDFWGGRALGGKLRMSAFRRCVDDREKMVGRASADLFCGEHFFFDLLSVCFPGPFWRRWDIAVQYLSV